jgi:hypothetical protein
VLLPGTAGLPGIDGNLAPELTDWRASYLILDLHNLTVLWRRVEYDRDATAEAYRKAGTPGMVKRLYPEQQFPPDGSP